MHELICKAIIESKRGNVVARIDAIDCRRAGTTVDAVREALRAECEDCAESATCADYWGRDVEGVDWRVQVTQ